MNIKGEQQIEMGGNVDNVLHPQSGMFTGDTTPNLSNTTVMGNLVIDLNTGTVIGTVVGSMVLGVDGGYLGTTADLGKGGSNSYSSPASGGSPGGGATTATTSTAATAATTAAKVASNQSTSAIISKLLGAGSNGLGNAASAGLNIDAFNAALGLQANAQNTTGQSAYIDQISKLKQLGLDANQQNITGGSAYIDQVSKLAQLGLSANAQNLQALQLYENGLISREQLKFTANAQNITGESAYRDQLLGMASEEDKQRAAAYHDVGRASLLQNETQSPYNPRPSTAMSPDLKNTLTALSSQGTQRLSTGAQYATTNMSAPKPYQAIASTVSAPTPVQPYSVGTLPTPTPYQPYNVGTLPTPTPYTPYKPAVVGTSTLQNLSNYLTPGMSLTSLLLKLYGNGSQQPGVANTDDPGAPGQ